MLFTFTVRDQGGKTLSARSTWDGLPSLLELYECIPYNFVVTDAQGIKICGAKVAYHPLSDRLVISGPVAGALLRLLRGVGFRVDRCTNVLQAGYTLELASLLEDALGVGEIVCAPAQPVAHHVIWSGLRRAEADMAGIREELRYTDGPRAIYLLRQLAHCRERIKLLQEQYAEQLSAYNRLRAGHRIPLLDGRSGIATRVNEQSVCLALAGGGDVTVTFGKIDMGAYSPN